MSREYALIRAQNAQNANVYINTRREPCKIALHAVGTPTARESMGFRSGRRFIKRK